MAWGADGDKDEVEEMLQLKRDAYTFSIYAARRPAQCICCVDVTGLFVNVNVVCARRGKLGRCVFAGAFISMTVIWLWLYWWVGCGY